MSDEVDERPKAESTKSAENSAEPEDEAPLLPPETAVDAERPEPAQPESEEPDQSRVDRHTPGEDAEANAQDQGGDEETAPPLTEPQDEQRAEDMPDAESEPEALSQPKDETNEPEPEPERNAQEREDPVEPEGQQDPSPEYEQETAKDAPPPPAETAEASEQPEQQEQSEQSGQQASEEAVQSREDLQKPDEHAETSGQDQDGDDETAPPLTEPQDAQPEERVEGNAPVEGGDEETATALTDAAELEESSESEAPQESDTGIAEGEETVAAAEDRVQDNGDGAAAENTVDDAPQDGSLEDSVKGPKVMLKREDNDFYEDHFVPIDQKSGLPKIDQQTGEVVKVGKSHLNIEGDLEPANPDGATTMTQHVIGGRDPNIKGNSSYTSFAPADGSGKVYGEHELQLDYTQMQRDIDSGELTGVEVHDPASVQQAIQDEIDGIVGEHVDVPRGSLPNGEMTKSEKADCVRQIAQEYGFTGAAKNEIAQRINAMSNTRRDDEWLIKGTIPTKYLTMIR